MLLDHLSMAPITTKHLPSGLCTGGQNPKAPVRWGFFIACSSITIMFCVQRVCTPATGSTPCNAGPRSLSHPRLALVRGAHGLA